MTRMTIDEIEFAKYAETNNIVLLMPRLSGMDTYQGNAPDVSRGCWDVFGQLSEKYTEQATPHMAPIMTMIQALNSTTIEIPKIMEFNQAKEEPVEEPVVEDEDLTLPPYIIRLP
jgi:hypothetical protein